MLIYISQEIINDRSSKSLLTITTIKKTIMKAFIVALLALSLTAGTVSSQTAKVKVDNSTAKAKVKPTSSTTQKAHNVVRRHHKRYNGAKYKSKNKITNDKTKVEVKKNKIEVKHS
jgi:hypothetical protein